MAQWDKFRAKLLGAQADNNIDFARLCTYLKRLGFDERIKGSHHVFDMDALPEILTLQAGGDGLAKGYQVKQVRELLLRYGL